MAALLGLIFDYLANKSGKRIEPYIIGGSVFIIGMSCTFIRFFPEVKAKFDYGMVMFILTFCLVVISGYRSPETLDIALDRILTVIMGVLVCVVVSMCIFPVWAGDDLHNLIVNNFDDLATSLEGCAKEYFCGLRKEALRRSSKISKGEPYNDAIYRGYRAVLVSKQTEESLANFAAWEPWHGRFGYTYPWKKCVQVGAILRHCAYAVCTLHSYILSDIQAPDSLRQSFAQPCMRISGEVVKILREIADTLKECSKTKRSKESMLEGLHKAVENLYQCPNLYLYDASRSLEVPLVLPNSVRGSSASLNKVGATSSSSWISPRQRDGLVIRPLSPVDNAPLPATLRSPPPQCRVSIPYIPKPPSPPGRFPKDEIVVESPAVGHDGGGPRHSYVLSSPKCQEFAESLSVTTVASLLIDIVSCMEPLLKAVAELEQEALFTEPGAGKLSLKPNLQRYNTEKIILAHSTSQMNPS